MVTNEDTFPKYWWVHQEGMLQQSGGNLTQVLSDDMLNFWVSGR